jgi:hypothetical protein
MARNVFPYIVAGALGAATLLGGSAAGAADTAVPEPCNGVAITDPVGDATIESVPGVGFPEPVARADADNDIKDIFLTASKGDDGKLAATVHMRVANVLHTPPAEAAMGVTHYYVDFTDVDGIQDVRATNTKGTWTYEYEQAAELPGGLPGPSEAVATTGSVVEGPNGIVSIDLPAALAKEGVKLDKLFGRITLTDDDTEFFVGYNTSDLAPDDGTSSTKSATVTACPAAEPSVEPTVPPVTAPPAAPPATTTQAPSPPPAVRPVAAKKVSKKAACRKKARKLKGAKRKRALKRCARRRK